MIKFKKGDRVRHKGLNYHGTITEEKDSRGRWGAMWDEVNYGPCYDSPNKWELIDSDWDE